MLFSLVLLQRQNKPCATSHEGLSTLKFHNRPLLTWKTAGWLKMPPDMTGHYDTCSLSNAAFTGDSIIFGSFHSGCTAQGQRRCFDLVAYERTLGRLKQSTAIPGSSSDLEESPRPKRS